MEFKKYDKNNDYSYVFGAFGTIELLKKQKQNCLAIIVDPSFVNNDAYLKIKKYAENIPIYVDLKLISKIRDKGNIYVIGVFKKYSMKVKSNKHILLYKINDVGLIGTIIRSMNGFNFKDLILIDCDIDLFNEHLIRSTMGAFFHINIEELSSFNEYNEKFNFPQLYLINNKEGKPISQIENDNFTLIFTNEKLKINTEKILFDKDVSLDNIVNIMLFSLYK